uniref:Uncharacterized protein n=1 Tax=Schistocephalus solidus TaxID=70667 RepID=A0A183TRG5_SCHSO
LGDRKPTELLRRMQILRGELHFNDKLFKEMFLECLPTDIQTILASGSEDLAVLRLAEMVNRMLEVQRFQPPSIAQLSTSPLLTPNEHPVTQMAAMVAEMASLKLQLVCLSSRRSSSRSPSRSRSHSRPRTADVCWYHTDFGEKAHRCSFPCSFKSPQETSLSENRGNRLLWLWSHFPWGRASRRSLNRGERPTHLRAQTAKRGRISPSDYEGWAHVQTHLTVTTAAVQGTEVTRVRPMFDRRGTKANPRPAVQSKFMRQAARQNTFRHDDQPPHH